MQARIEEQIEIPVDKNKKPKNVEHVNKYTPKQITGFIFGPLPTDAPGIAAIEDTGESFKHWTNVDPFAVEADDVSTYHPTYSKRGMPNIPTEV